MYELLTVYTDHDSLHWLLTIDDPSRLLIRFGLRLAEFYFEVKYKKGKINTQADELSRLYTAVEKIPQDDDDDIPVFHVVLVNVELKCNKNLIEVDFIAVQYA